jgi:4-carboxymuconolactone decarboxylase
MEDFHLTLRRLSIRDERLAREALGTEAGSVAASGLDHRSHALVRIGALIALDAAVPSYAAAAEDARQAGATDEEIVGTLVATMSIVGTPRVVSAAPKLGLALGYDLDDALESAAV